MALVVKNLPANAGEARDMGLTPGLGRSPGEGNGNPLQYSCLENPMDRAAWRATVHIKYCFILNKIWVAKRKSAVSPMKEIETIISSQWERGGLAGRRVVIHRQGLWHRQQLYWVLCERCQEFRSGIQAVEWRKVGCRKTEESNMAWAWAGFMTAKSGRQWWKGWHGWS